MRLRRNLSLVLAALLLLAVGLPGYCAAAPEGYKMPYYIVVDISNQVVTVYDAATGDIARQMLCSTGSNNYTPKGNFILPKGERDDRKPWYYIQMFKRYVRYATRIQGQILFHSLPYYRKSLQSVDTQAASELGLPTSHGCIRLRWQDAEFIAQKCLPGTAVKIMESGSRDDGLRELLRQQSYDIDDGLSYESFLGITDQPGALGRSAEGQAVLDLQYRLRDLGLYDGKQSGVYDSATVNAVRAAQYLMGGDVSGVATPQFLEAIYGADAPTAMEVRLREGMSGPSVRVLQDNLAVLKLYTDAPDSVYDAAVVEAVKRFERAYCYDEDGVAAPQVQKAIAYEAGKVTETFAGGDYDCEWATEPLEMARANAKSGVKVRESASQDSKQLARLSMGKSMIVAEKGKEWSRVRAGGREGYVKNSLVDFYERDITLLKYTGAEGLVYTVGNGADDYRAGAKLPGEVFAEYLAANDQRVDVGSLVGYATVQTGDETLSLNLRQSPDANSAILASVEDGTKLRVQRRYTDWTQVTYQGQTGYLMNQYLSFWTGPKDALEEALDGEEEPQEARAAVVKSAAGGKAQVYEEDYDDAKVLGRLPDGTRLEVLEYGDGWCRVRYEGHEGYMIAEDLRLEPVDDRLTEELRP